jgi:hypothetical protein
VEFTSDTFNPLQELFGLANTALKADAAKKLAGQPAALGVDEYGNAFPRGAPGGTLAGLPPVVLIGAGVLALALLVYLAKN